MFESDLLAALSRNSLAFFFASGDTRLTPTIWAAEREPFGPRIQQALARTSPVFRQHRRRHSALISRLDAAELMRHNLSECNFSGLRFVKADLVRAHLYGSDLSWASLYQANLEGADLQHSVLHRTDLREANLDAALLNRADLRGARLDGASLRWADLRGARLAGANLCRADLREARIDPGFDPATVVSDAATKWPEAMPADEAP
jgi:hypothetical protein